MFRPARVLSVALLAVLGSLGAAAGAAEPVPLLKPVTPAGGAARVRLPVAEDAQTFAQLRGAIPNPKKKGETVAVKVLIDTLPNVGRVSLKTWKDWGFEVPANRQGVLPELLITGTQLGTKGAKGGDVEFRATNIKLSIVEPPAGSEAALGCDLWVSVRDLTGGTDRTAEARYHFADRFLELTAPGAAVKKLNTADVVVPEPKATEGELVPVAGLHALRGGIPTFGFAAVNGRSEYTTPAGKAEKVNAMVSSITNYAAPGIVMTLNTARGCGVELEKQPADGETVTGKVKEFRLALLTGPDLKAPKDFVLKDVTVAVVDEKTMAAVWLGPRFVEEYFADGVLGCGSDGVWKLHGRVKPDRLADPKTRTPPKK